MNDELLLELLEEKVADMVRRGVAWAKRDRLVTAYNTVLQDAQEQAK